MPLPQKIQGPPQDVVVQALLETQRQGEVIGRAVRVFLIHQPQCLLALGQKGSVVHALVLLGLDSLSSLGGLIMWAVLPEPDSLSIPIAVRKSGWASARVLSSADASRKPAHR